MLGATGALYAVRRKLYVPPKDDTLLDDVFIPLKIVAQGFRAIFDPHVKVYDRISQDITEESQRKIRTLAGNWQLFVRLKNMFNPFRSSIAVQLFSHKFLRVIIPYLMITLFITNIFLLDMPWYLAIFIIQVVFYACAVCGFLFPRLQIRILTIPYTFCVLNIAAVKGFFVFATKSQKVAWK